MQHGSARDVAAKHCRIHVNAGAHGQRLFVVDPACRPCPHQKLDTVTVQAAQRLNLETKRIQARVEQLDVSTVKHETKLARLDAQTPGDDRGDIAPQRVSINQIGGVFVRVGGAGGGGGRSAGVLPRRLVDRRGRHGQGRTGVAGVVRPNHDTSAVELHLAPMRASLIQGVANLPDGQFEHLVALWRFGDRGVGQAFGERAGQLGDVAKSNDLIVVAESNRSFQGDLVCIPRRRDKDHSHQRAADAAPPEPALPFVHRVLHLSYFVPSAQCLMPNA